MNYWDELKNRANKSIFGGPMVLSIEQWRLIEAVVDAAKSLGCGQSFDCMGYGFIEIEDALKALEQGTSEE